MMTKAKIVQTESGDWYLVDADYAEDFVDDEYEDQVDYDKVITALDSPDSIVITSFENE